MEFLVALLVLNYIVLAGLLANSSSYHRGRRTVLGFIAVFVIMLACLPATIVFRLISRRTK